MNQTILKVGILLGFVVIAGVFLFLKTNNVSLPLNTRTTNDSTLTPTPVSKTFSMEDVAIHKDKSSCFSTVNGKVYDLTSWINQHPGGAERILMICGKDGSDLFNKQHQGQGRPEGFLSTFYIGDLITK